MRPIGAPGGRIPLKRAAVISLLVMKHSLGDVTERLLGRTKRGKEAADEHLWLRSGFPTPTRFRMALQDLGPTFVKMGQLMSTRADIFPPEYIEEFKKLQDQVPPAPFSDIKQLVEGQLRRPLLEVFAEFDPEPLAAASVAQVHLATTRNNERVAVKVIRPRIRGKIQEDIRLMYYLAARFEKTFEMGRIIGATELVKEFERVIYKELDMFIEGGSIEKFRKNFRGSSEIYIPKVYWDYTTKSVLVMEHIDGIKMDHVQEIEAQGIDPKEVALIGLRSFSKQLMEYGFFHADPHPGNTIVLRDGKVSLVDFGITGYLDNDTKQQVANLFLGYAEHDYDMVMDALRNAGLVDEQTQKLGNFRADLEDMSETFYGRSLSTISFKDMYDQIMRLVLKYRVRLPRNLLLLLKTFVQTEALGKILKSDASILEVTRPYAIRLIEREHDPRKAFRRMNREARDVGGHVKVMPKFMHEILRQVAEGKQRIELVHGGFHDLDVQIDKAVNRLTVGMIVCASVIGGSLVLNSSQTIMEFTIEFLGDRTISLTGLLGICGYGIATILGLWLIISIFRKGRL
ncbi:MAG: AarF/ABC1/UbiB kinase family protein [Deltaproteobacteria bacterium]|nr:AarF/ABC1/UbiB kinase family protein [Deltaproteobacteria bacterium]